MFSDTQSVGRRVGRTFVNGVFSLFCLLAAYAWWLDGHNAFNLRDGFLLISVVLSAVIFVSFSIYDIYLFVRKPTLPRRLKTSATLLGLR